LNIFISVSLCFQKKPINLPHPKLTNIGLAFSIFTHSAISWRVIAVASYAFSVGREDKESIYWLKGSIEKARTRNRDMMVEIKRLEID
jgi:hypothetical protein